MRSWAALAALVGLAGCATDRGAEQVVHPGLPLANAGFEQAAEVDRCPPGWSCVAHNGVHSHRMRSEARSPGHGSRSLCADPLEPVDNWLYVYQLLPAEGLRGKRVRLSALVRDAGDAGTGAGPSVLAQGIDGGTLVHQQRLARDTGGWQRLTAEIAVPPNAFHVQAGILFESHAPACADDVRLEIAPPG